MRWTLVLFILFFLLLSYIPQLKKLGLGSLPGDFSFTILGKKIELPFMSTLLLAGIAVLLMKFL